MKKSKNKKIIWIISGVITVVSIGMVVYSTWPKNKSVESEKQINLKEEVWQLRNRLSFLEGFISELPDIDQKTRNFYLKKISYLESLIGDTSKQEKQDKSTVKRLKKEIEKLKNRLKDEDCKSIKEQKVRFVTEVQNDEDKIIKCCFNNFLEQGSREVKYFYISKKHPQIKELLSKGKLQEKKQFIILYGKADKQSEVTYDFNEFNQELEIIEV